LGLAATEADLKKRHPLSQDYAEVCGLLGMAEFACNDLQNSEKHICDSLKLERQYADLTATAQTERQQLIFRAHAALVLDMFMSVTRTVGLADEAVYAEVVRWKGAIFNRQRLVQCARQARTADAATALLSNQLETATRQLTKLLLTSRTEENLHELESLAERVDSIQQRLSIK